ncbi:MAG: methyltransferase domain-containing protein [Candidatus Cloacimonetes bacterium]|nr:methyltransferase domain-containing protein [Candidatus Cloacimonadota bacterium]
MMNPKQYYKDLIEKWIEEEKQKLCGIDSKDRYLQNHRKRFEYLMELCKNLNHDKSAKILDIGRSDLSVLLTKYYLSVTTLGLDLEVDKGGHRERETINLKHIVFDLNESKNVQKWTDEKFDLIVYSEVIEHIYEAPEFSLLFLNYLLNLGGFIIITTPNAASLYRRLKLLLGENTISRIRFYNLNPAHYREYTKEELIQMAEMCELKVVKHEYLALADNPDSLKSRIFNLITKIIPQFRWSQVLILSKK